MADWKNSTQREGGGVGSYNGVEFYIQSLNVETGRRTVIHQFPGRDKPQTEDLGRRPRIFSLVCFVLGDDYVTDRDRLRKAFETFGSGVFEHPLWGRISVVVAGPVRITENTREAGFARFNVRLSEVGKAPAKKAVTDTGKALTSASESAQTGLAAGFDKAVSVAGEAAKVVSEAVSKAQAVASQIRTIRGKIDAALSVITDVEDAIAAFDAEVTALLNTPAIFAARINSLVLTCLGPVTTAQEAAEEALNLVTGGTPAIVDRLTASLRVSILREAVDSLATYGADFEVVDTPTATGVAIAANQAALIDLVRGTGAIVAAGIAADLDYTSADEAIELRDALVLQFDAIADNTADDELFATMQDLRVGVVDHLTARSLTLPRINYYTPPTTLPTLVIAYELYGDADRGTEIALGNNLDNPGFAPGGAALAVLGS